VDLNVTKRSVFYAKKCQIAINYVDIMIARYIMEQKACEEYCISLFSEHELNEYVMTQQPFVNAEMKSN